MNLNEIQPHFDQLTRMWHGGVAENTPWKGFAVSIDRTSDGSLQPYIAVYCASDLPSVVRELVQTAGKRQEKPLVREEAVQRFVALGSPGVAPEPIAPAKDIVAGRQISARRHGGNGPLGSIGAFLRKQGDPRVWLLSAHHILAFSDTPGDTLSVALAGAPVNRSTVTTAEPTLIPLGGINAPADAAAVPIAASHNARISLALPGLRNGQPFDANGDLSALTQIQKIGGSGVSTDRITSLQATVTVEILQVGDVVLTNQLLSPIHALPGDSGSLAVDLNTGRPVGLLVAQSSDGSKTVISPMAAVFGGLGSDFSLLLPMDTV